MTEDAAAAIRALVAPPDVPAGAGLRITTDHTDATNRLMLRVAPEPADNDAVVETDGARLFLDRDVAMALADKTLDAHADTDGVVRFSVTDPMA